MLKKTISDDPLYSETPVIQNIDQTLPKRKLDLPTASKSRDDIIDDIRDLSDGTKNSAFRLQQNTSFVYLFTCKILLMFQRKKIFLRKPNIVD